jgi:hypothetical protein
MLAPLHGRSQAAPEDDRQDTRRKGSEMGGWIGGRREESSGRTERRAAGTTERDKMPLRRRPVPLVMPTSYIPCLKIETWGTHSFWVSQTCATRRLW